MGTVTDRPTELGAAVGPHCTNAPADVTRVQQLLSAIDPAQGGASFDAADLGTASPALTDAIRRFQRKNRLEADGKVGRGGSTWQAMVELADGLYADQLLVQVDGIQWQDWGHENLPPLRFAATVDHDWELEFGGYDGDPAMVSRAYVCARAAGTPHIGVALPSGNKPPDAYLIYFHHGIGQEWAAYAAPSTRLDKGIGDYLIGRMRGMAQIANSGKNVCLIVPQPTFAGRGFFDSGERVITEVLAEIDRDLNGGKVRELPPLILASYSNGLEPMCNFLGQCSGLAKKVMAIYDFDGMLISKRPYDTLSSWASAGKTVIRYVGRSSPPRRPKEDDPSYLNRTRGGAARIVALPQTRWVNHPHYPEFKQDPTWANSWWMHFYIPSCMLFHALANTPGI